MGENRDRFVYLTPAGRQWDKAAVLEGVDRAAFSHWVRFLIGFGGRLYAGIEKGSIYQSPDGVTWSQVGQEVTLHTGVRGAAIFKEALFVGTTGGGEIWRSKDGLTWQRVFKAPTHIRRGYVASMAVARNSLFAGIDGHVFQTTEGLSWREVGHLGPLTIEAMAPFRDALYAGIVMPPSGHIYIAQLEQNQ